MRALKDSDIFEWLSSKDAINAKIVKALSSKNTKFITTELNSAIEEMKKMYKHPSTLQMVAEFNAGNIVMFYGPQEEALSTFIPFFKFKQHGKEKVGICLTKYLVIHSYGSNDSEVDYSIDVKKLYSIMYSAYLYLEIFNERTVLPSVMDDIVSTMWSRLFNKVLKQAIGLSTNKDRYDAFMYLAKKFFLIYYMEYPEKNAETVALFILPHGKNFIVKSIESKCTEKNINMFENFATFCNTLFNNDITNVQGIRTANIQETMNYQFYIKRFVNMFSMNAILSLASYPYFMYLIIAANNWSYLIANTQALNDVCMNEKEWAKLQNVINTALR